MGMRRHNWSERQERKQGRRFARTPFFKKRKPVRRKNETLKRGQRNERRVLEALQRFAKPSWALKVRHGTRQEDRFEGKDIVVLTTDGWVALQVKSSLSGLKKFMNGKHGSNPRLGAIVVLDHESPEIIAEKAWCILTVVYHEAKLLSPLDVLVQKIA